MLEDLHRATMNLEPGQSVAEDPTVQQRVLRARRGGKVSQLSLQGEELLQSFDVAASERQ